MVPLKQFQRLLGHMASAAAVTPLGLLHMRSLQHWLHSRVPRWAWCRGTLRVGITQQCRRSLSPWMDLAFLRAGGAPRTSVSGYCCHNWSHTQFKSLRAVRIPGQLNRAANALSRQLLFPGEWRFHPETIWLIWSRFGEAQVDLFASPESSHCQLYFSLTEGPSAQTHWHTAGLGPYASMRFPQ